jgi:SPP1 family phage portal protein
MEKLTADEVKKIVEGWQNDPAKQQISMYSQYYQAENPPLVKRIKDRNYRGKTPNNFVPTAYYTTVVDSMAGYLFSDVEYNTEDSYSENIKSVLDDNRQAIKDMKLGVQAMAYNRAVELVYANERAEPMFSVLNPASVIPLYTDDIEPILFAIIWVRDADSDKIVDVIYHDEWQYYRIKKGAISQREDPRELFFSECPAVVYETQIIGHKPPFHQIVPYIDALDWLISGNSNEIERLVDALLVLGNTVKKEDLEHMDEWKALQGMKSDMRAEYLTKDMSPQFREYVSKLLIQEIHKHAHVVDWYNPDSGLSGATSGKALLTRMFDMDMYSNRIEKVFREGTEKRLKLIGEIQSKKGIKVEPVTVNFKRNRMTDVEEKIVALSQAVFLSAQTKIEEAGFDYEVEKERLETESNARMDAYGEIDEA